MLQMNTAAATNPPLALVPAPQPAARPVTLREQSAPAANEDPAEREAARVALEGSAFERARLAVRSIRALLRDPNDTRQVFYLGLVASRPSFPAFLARWALDDEGARLLREQPSIDSDHIDLDHLRALPADTLGGAYVRFLDAKELDPDLFQAPPGLPEVPRYLSKRMRQVHDLWHVLTGYDTDIAGEIALQAFSYAQTNMPAPAMIVLIAGLKNAPSQPRIVPMAIEGYRRGRKAKFLPPLWLEERFEQPLAQVRAELGLS